MANPLPNWQIEIRDPLNAVSKAVYDNVTNPGGVVSGFEFITAPSGDCLSMTFTVVMRLPDGSRAFAGDALDLIKLRLDGVEAWAGVIVQRPDTLNPDARQVVCASRKTILRDTSTPPERFLDVTDASTLITRAITGFYLSLPASVSYNAAKIQTGTGSLEKFYLPHVTLGDALEKLAEVSNTLTKNVYGVDRIGDLFMRETTGVLEVDWNTLPSELEYGDVQAENPVTSVNLVLTSKNPEVISSTPPRVIESSTSAQSLVPIGQVHRGYPIAVTYSHALNGSFKRYANKAVGYGEKFQPVTISLSTLPYFTPGDFAVTTETNDRGQVERVLTNITTAAAIINWLDVAGCYGARLRYSTLTTLDKDAIGLSIFTYGLVSGVEQIVDFQFAYMPYTGGHNRPVTVEMRFKYDGPYVVTKVNVNVGTQAFAAANLRIIEFVPIKPALSLERVAAAEYRLPASIVTAVPLQGFYAPVKTLRILNHPTMGTLEADTAEWRYSYSSEAGFMTTVQLGNKDTGENVRQMLILDRDFDRRNIMLTRGIVGG